jgi:hypothetical protein
MLRGSARREIPPARESAAASSRNSCSSACRPDPQLRRCLDGPCRSDRFRSALPGAGRRLDSPALIADGHHARADAYVSRAVIASAVVVALGAPVAVPPIGLGIALVILRITWQSWATVRGHSH